MSRGHVFSHDTAVLLYGLPLPLYARTQESLHVTVPAGSHRPEVSGVVGHQLSTELWQGRDIVMRDYELGELWALPAVTPAVAWAQLAERLDLDDLVALGDALVTGAEPLASLDELHTITRVWASRRGARARARAVGRIRVGPLSRPESLLRLLLVRAGIPEPELNVTVADRQDAPIAMADLSWPEFRVLVEYEGDWHRTSPAKFRSDITRGEKYADGGWFGLRASADDVFGDPNLFIARLSRRLRARGWRPSQREPRNIVAARW